MNPTERPETAETPPPVPPPIPATDSTPPPIPGGAPAAASGPLDLATEVDRFRKKLLDLTTRNSLLNYRKSKRRSLQIVDELPNQVFDHLVNKGRRFKFVAAEEPADDDAPVETDEIVGADWAGGAEAGPEEPAAASLELPVEPDDPTEVQARHRDDRLQTTEDADHLERKLKVMRADANAVIDETGANHLYLALGMLSWTESREERDTHLAPLVLVPVTLERSFEARTQRWRYTIHHNGEELQSNLSLQVKLDEDFGLRLPDFDEGMEPETYFDSVRRVIADREGWQLRREAVLGFFSFTRFLMYRDLDPASWPPARALPSNEQLKALFEGREIETGRGLYLQDYAIDERNEGDVPLALDADSSQHSALIDVAAGRSLVIEGPPGTGKSQTITNIIAWALSEGKTVLFVAEKLAALEVVGGNLERLGLGDLCLEIHSRKARPAEVYKSLGDRLEKRFPPASHLGARRQRLEAEKRTLQGYLDACAETVGPHAVPLHEAFWQIVELRSRGHEPLRPASLRTDLSLDDLEERRAYFDELRRFADEIGPPADHLWSGFDSIGYDASREGEARAALGRMTGAARSLVEVGGAIADASGVTWSPGLSSVERATHVGLDLLDVDDATLLPPLCRRLADDAATRLARSLVDDLQTHANEREIAAQLPLREPEHVEEAATRLHELLGTDLGRAIDQVTFDTTHRQRDSLRSLADAVEGIHAATVQLGTVGFADIRTVADFQRACDVYRRLRDPLLRDYDLSPEYFYDSTHNVLLRAKEQQDTLATTREELDTFFALTDAPDSATLAELRTTLRQFARRRLRILSGTYRAAKREVGAFLRPDVRFEPGLVADRLEALEQFRVTRAEFAEERAFAHALGPLFRGMDTDWTTLEQLVGLARALHTLSVHYEDVESVREAIESHEDPPAPEPLREQSDRLLIRLDDGVVHDLFREASWLRQIEHARLDEIAGDITRAREILEGMHEHAGAFSIAGRLPVKVIRDTVEALIRCREIRERVGGSAEYAELVGETFDGVDTPVEPLARTLRWIEGVRRLELPGALLQWLLAEDVSARGQQLRNWLDDASDACEEWRSGAVELTRFGRVDQTWLAGGDDGLRSGPDLLARMEALEAGLVDLAPWSDFCRALERAATLGLADFADAVRQGHLSADAAKATFELTYLDLLSRDAINRYPTLRYFTRQQHEEARRRFQELDEEIQVHARREIAHRAAQRDVPAGVQTGRVRDLTQLGLISHEIKKERRHCRLRQLMTRAGDAVLALKPCLMLSPLSVAQFLPPGEVEFDLVVMDEASQIRPEDALGAIVRGKQLIVVGDPKQLPPTSFWDRIGTNETDDDDATIVDDTESILEVAMKAFSAVRRLRWHYRSQHECLIAFSNDRFYDGDLIVFPSPTTEAGRLGLRHHFAEGGAFSGGANRPEAMLVAQAIARHARDNARQSLGVGTFNRAQADLIEECLDTICRDDAHARRAVERLQEGDEGLFVKNLENLQGDERDVIFISYTYGPDPETGRVYQRFGPITHENGWRRLNVLITRARQRVEVFSSMHPGDITGGGERSRGVGSMREYLEYVRAGIVPPREFTEATGESSPFELAIARVLTEMGLKVVPRVGVAGYFIDLAVLKPGATDEFLLGIECDGPAYHAALSVRDRDRLREQVMRRRGWHLHRVWSADWFFNQAAEEQRLRRRVEELLGKA